MTYREIISNFVFKGIKTEKGFKELHDHNGCMSAFGYSQGCNGTNCDKCFDRESKRLIDKSLIRDTYVIRTRKKYIK